MKISIPADSWIINLTFMSLSMLSFSMDINWCCLHIEIYAACEKVENDGVEEPETPKEVLYSALDINISCLCKVSPSSTSIFLSAHVQLQISQERSSSEGKRPL